MAIVRTGQIYVAKMGDKLFAGASEELVTKAMQEYNPGKEPGVDYSVDAADFVIDVPTYSDYGDESSG